MKKFKDLIKTPEYWIEEIQNELYRQLTDYMKKTGKSQNDIANELKVSKSYVSQILNGNFNFTLKKLIDLSLYVGRVPDLNFSLPEVYLSEFNKKEISRGSEKSLSTYHLTYSPANKLKPKIKSQKYLQRAQTMPRQSVVSG